MAAGDAPSLLVGHADILRVECGHDDTATCTRRAGLRAGDRSVFDIVGKRPLLAIDPLLLSMFSLPLPLEDALRSVEDVLASLAPHKFDSVALAPGSAASSLLCHRFRLAELAANRNIHSKLRTPQEERMKGWQRRDPRTRSSGRHKRSG